MTPDIIGEALVQAFADRGYRARLETPGSLVVTLPDGRSVGPLDIGEWRAFAGRNPRADLPENAAGFVRGFLRRLEGGPAAEPAEPHGDVPASGGLPASGVPASGGAGDGERAARRLQEHSEIDRLIAEERLRVRLYTEEELSAVPGMREALVNRPLAPGLLQTVVVDYPDALMPLNRTSIGDTPENEVFAAALRASIDKEPHYTKTDTVWDVPVLHIGETHRYVGAHVHVLRRYLGAAPYGALVAFPIPEYVILHEISLDTHVFGAMELMQSLARSHAERGEKPLTPQVYWWRAGAYEALPEDEALRSGLVPELRPVGIEVDHEQKTVAAVTAASDELITLWMRDR